MLPAFVEAGFLNGSVSTHDALPLLYFPCGTWVAESKGSCVSWIFAFPWIFAFQSIWSDFFLQNTESAVMPSEGALRPFFFSWFYYTGTS